MACPASREGLVAQLCKASVLLSINNKPNSFWPTVGLDQVLLYHLH